MKTGYMSFPAQEEYRPVMQEYSSKHGGVEIEYIKTPESETEDDGLLAAFAPK